MNVHSLTVHLLLNCNRKFHRSKCVWFICFWGLCLFHERGFINHHITSLNAVWSYFFLKKDTVTRSPSTLNRNTIEISEHNIKLTYYVVMFLVKTRTSFIILKNSIWLSFMLYTKKLYLSSHNADCHSYLELGNL